MAADGTGVRPLTDGPFDDFSPRYLPGGDLIFISTRRGGYHRCGRGPCPTYTLATARADGSNPHRSPFTKPTSGTRWSRRTGRSFTRAGTTSIATRCSMNNCGRRVPTAAACRLFTATTRSTRWASGRRVRCPARVAYGHRGRAPRDDRGLDHPAGHRRCPRRSRARHAAHPRCAVSGERSARGQSRQSGGVERAAGRQANAAAARGGSLAGALLSHAVPLSEKYFLAAYSFDRLLGEPDPNPSNMFGIYFVDCFGNKELLHRDPEICSLWPVPLRARVRPPAVASQPETGAPLEGAFFLQNVYESWPPLPAGAVKRLRIVQVLPKTTWHANEPMVGLAMRLRASRCSAPCRWNRTARPISARPPKWRWHFRHWTNWARPCKSCAASPICSRRDRRVHRLPRPTALGAPTAASSPGRPARALVDSTRPGRLVALELPASGATGARRALRSLPQPRQARRRRRPDG